MKSFPLSFTCAESVYRATEVSGLAGSKPHPQELSAGSREEADLMKVMAFFLPRQCLWELIPGASLSSCCSELSLLPPLVQDSSTAFMAKCWEHHGVRDGIQKS